MVKIALDPTPYHHDYALVEFPDVVARLGYEHMQLTPHADFTPFFRYPKADSQLVQKLKRRAADAGVSIPAILPVQRISSPVESQRITAVKNFKRVIQLAVDLEIPVINTEFSGRPELQEESEAAFYVSMEELLPIIEAEGLRINFDPHPDDFVEDGLEAWRVLRGLDSAHVGFVYVASHTFHYGDRAATLLPEIGAQLGAVYVADTFDHRRSHGLRYISNPPGNAARIHQHLEIGAGDVDFEGLFGELAALDYFGREGALVVSNVFAEDERADEVSILQREKIKALITNV